MWIPSRSSPEHEIPKDEAFFIVGILYNYENGEYPPKLAFRNLLLYYKLCLTCCGMPIANYYCVLIAIHNCAR